MTLPHLLAQVKELEKLRISYERATPRQRFKVALDRINNPDHYPNDLVTRVSAVEALARSLLAHSLESNRDDIQARHRSLGKLDAPNLIARYAKVLGTTPAELFGIEDWELFRIAVAARNLLAHECTYLDAQSYLPLANAATEVLFALRKTFK
jgi:hypothetical protein